VQLDELAKLADADRLKATVETIPPLSNAIRGHELSERSDMRGKIVLGVV
jgi:NADPH:quinone reductase-like Zn-dependent oxidoreductase